jgi:RimJ/RimL family protein N-acetyltransferase
MSISQPAFPAPATACGKGLQQYLQRERKIIETPQLVLRPVVAEDSSVIADVIFSDPNVAGMLAHDIRNSEDALKAAKKWTSTMGIDSNKGIWNDGGLGLFAVLPRETGGELAGVAGFYMDKNKNGLWNGEYFFALGTPWHGKGLMSEIADRFGEILKTMPDLGVIYAWYWDMINEASGRVLRRTGFSPKGRKLVSDEYDIQRCHTLFNYDLWRLSQVTKGAHRKKVAVEVARRAGAFVAEDAITRDEALTKMTMHAPSGQMSPEALAMFDHAIASPGMAHLEIQGEGITAINI